MARDPVEFTRITGDGHNQRCGNRVQLEDENANPVTAANPLPVDAANTAATPTYVDDIWSIGLQADEGANDNDKTITVTAGQAWQILWIWIEYIADSNVGERQIVIEIQDAANDVIGQFRAGIIQEEDETRYYMFACSLADLTAFRDTVYLMSPLPPTLILQPGDQIRIYDNNNTSAADDMVIQIQYGYKVLP